MIVVTGAAGFIGSCMVQALHEAGYTDILAVDDFSRPDKARNLAGKPLWGQVHRLNFIRWLERHHADVDAVFHLGARTDTTEMNTAIFDELNYEYSRSVYMLCAGFQIPFIYASSAATYGLGEHGYSDDHALIPLLRPLNPYGQSKQDFDCWLLNHLQGATLTNQDSASAPTIPKNAPASTTNPKGASAPTTPPDNPTQRPEKTNQAPPPRGGGWEGAKFFNVYGPNEYHKGRMASVIFHTARQIKATGKMQLFKSHRPDYADGQQSRDFIYVKDVCAVLLHFFEQQVPNGIYNLGTGKARSFLDLATATFRALGREPDISFIDTPVDIRDTYQYFTQAEMGKVRRTGYIEPFYTLEDGIEDYVQRYLKEEKIW